MTRTEVECLTRKLCGEWAIPVTDEQVEAIVRVALEPKWLDTDRWAASVIDTAVRALRVTPRAKGGASK